MLDQAAVFDDLKEVVRHGGNSVFLAVTIDAVVDFNAHGVAFFTMVGQIRTFDEQEAVINGIAEENTGKRFRNDCLYSKCLKNTRCLLSGGSASEVLSSNYKISRFNLFGKIRIQWFKCVALHFIQIRQKQILGCNDLIGIKVIMKFKDRSFCHDFICSFLI